MHTYIHTCFYIVCVHVCMQEHVYIIIICIFLYTFILYMYPYMCIFTLYVSICKYVYIPCMCMYVCKQQHTRGMLILHIVCVNICIHLYYIHPHVFILIIYIRIQTTAHTWNAHFTRASLRGGHCRFNFSKVQPTVLLCSKIRGKLSFENFSYW